MNLSTFLIVCPLTFLAGFVDSVAGGGGLIHLEAVSFTYKIKSVKRANSVLHKAGEFAEDVRSEFAK